MDKCDICQREAEKVTVYADPDFPSSSGYCEECLKNNAFIKSIVMSRAMWHDQNNEEWEYPLTYFEDGKYVSVWPVTDEFREYFWEWRKTQPQ